MAGDAGSPGEPVDCGREDAELAKWTFLRYGVLGLIFLWQVWKLKEGARKAETLEKTSSQEKKAGSKDGEDATREGFGLTAALLGGSTAEPDPATAPAPTGSLVIPDYKELPYKQHPKLTTDIRESNNMLWSVVLAGWLFVLTEGVGLIIYFSMSAALDNFAIFFVKGSGGVCATVKAMSLYTMAVVTFLPNVLVGSWLQRKLYNEGTWKLKVLFAAIMACITTLSFVARMWLVYVDMLWVYSKGGWVTIVSWALQTCNVSSHWRVALAVVVPPIVDGIQSTALIMTGSHAKPLLAVMVDKQNENDKDLKNEIRAMRIEMKHELDAINFTVNEIKDNAKKWNPLWQNHTPAEQTPAEPTSSSF